MRDWRDEQWDNQDWDQARTLANEFWAAKRSGLYVYEATRALQEVDFERSRRWLQQVEQEEWDWYCRIYPDLKEGAGEVVDDPKRGADPPVDVAGVD